MKVVAIGGSTRPGSGTQLLLDRVLGALADRGADCRLFAGADLALPHYEPGIVPVPAAERIVEAVRVSDAVLIGSPGYHGSLSGLVKNALDYLEALRDDVRPYLSDRPVGLVVTAYGWQAAVTTLTAMRQIVHALRGWPAPLGIAVNVAEVPEGLETALAAPALDARVEELARQVASAAHAFTLARVEAAS
jgi:FMN reductase